MNYDSHDYGMMEIMDRNDKLLCHIMKANNKNFCIILISLIIIIIIIILCFNKSLNMITKDINHIINNKQKFLHLSIAKPTSIKLPLRNNKKKVRIVSPNRFINTEDSDMITSLMNISNSNSNYNNIGKYCSI